MLALEPRPGRLQGFLNRGDALGLEGLSQGAETALAISSAGIGTMFQPQTGAQGLIKPASVRMLGSNGTGHVQFYCVKQMSTLVYFCLS